MFLKLVVIVSFNENTCYSAMLNIPELVPPRNQFQQFQESAPTNSYHTRNQLPLIPTDSRNRLQFRPIPRCINSWNSARFRNRMIIVRFPYSTTGTCIQFRNGIPGIGSDSGILNRNQTSAVTLMHCDMLEGYSIWTQSNSGQGFRESFRNRISRNCMEFPEFLGIPTDSGISGNWFRFRNSWLEFDHH
jgi:hypothetical protein